MSKELSVEQVENLQETIKKLTTECAETEGAIKQIKTHWKSEYKCDSKEEMEKLQEKTIERIKMLEAKREGLVAKIQEIVPENILEKLLDEEEDE